MTPAGHLSASTPQNVSIDLFTSAELNAISQLCNLGIDRDEALQALMTQGWSWEGALSILRPAGL